MQKAQNIRGSGYGREERDAEGMGSVEVGF